LRAVAVALLLTGSALAAPAGAAQDADAFISNLGTQAIQVLGPSAQPAQRAARFRQLYESDFDIAVAARFVLGPSGRTMTPQQLQEFAGLFREYLVQAYTRRLGEYGGEQFRVTGNRQAGDETIVTSQVMRRSGNPVEMDWHVAEHGGRLVITDVTVDGVSMKVTHRNEFAQIIQRNGGRADSLIAVLRQQLAQGPGAAPQSGSSLPPAAAPQSGSSLPPDAAPRSGSSLPPGAAPMR